MNFENFVNEYAPNISEENKVILKEKWDELENLKRLETLQLEIPEKLEEKAHEKTSQDRLNKWNEIISFIDEINNNKHL